MARNPFAGGNPSPVGARDIVPVTPDTPFGFTAAALYITTGGTLVITTEAGNVRTLTVPDNFLLPVGATLVAASSTATGIHALMIS